MTDRPLIRIVDDDEALAASCALLLESMGWETATHASGEDFLARGDVSRPGCIILDVQMPGLDGLAVHERLLEMGSTVPVLFLTAHGSIPLAVRAMRRGAVDFLEKPVDPMSLIARVAQCAAQSSAKKAEEKMLAGRRSRFDSLTPREREVIDRVLTNAANKVIARDLGLEVSTVKMHRANAFAKLGVHSSGELWQLASDCGLTNLTSETPHPL